MSEADLGLQSRIDDFRQKKPVDLSEGLLLLNEARSQGFDEQVRELEDFLQLHDSGMELAVDCTTKLNDFEESFDDMTTSYEDALGECREIMDRLDLLPTAESVNNSTSATQKVLEKVLQIEGDVKEMKKSVEDTISGFQKLLTTFEEQATKAVAHLKEFPVPKTVTVGAAPQGQPMGNVPRGAPLHRAYSAGLPQQAIQPQGQPMGNVPSGATGAPLQRANSAALPQQARPKCTISWAGPMKVLQHGYECHTCGLRAAKLICEECAMHCHRGHELKDCGLQVFLCSCGADDSLCQIDHKECRCSYFITGRNYRNQGMWECHTCGFCNGKCICKACAENCHKGHELKWRGWCDCFCDCGPSGKCKVCPCPRH